jgi:hypothetical protein
VKKWSYFMSGNSHQEQHEMQLEKIHLSGAEEWYCPTCGRRFLLRWPPAYEKIIVEAGDMHASHTGGKRNSRTQPLHMNEVAEESVLSPELRAALEEVLKNVSFGD